MSAIVLKPGAVPLHDLADASIGATPSRLDPACRQGVSAAADLVAAIVAKGEPVYGINTGFGKLATVRIDAGDLATLQRNIVLSHAAGVGEPTPPRIVRLMMALKLASLAQGASGVRLETLDLLEAMLERDVIPVVPSQGSAGASGDLAPLAHMTAVMLGVGEATFEGRRSLRLPTRSPLSDCSRSRSARRKGLALLNGTQFSTAFALAGLFEVGARVPLRTRHRRALDRRRTRLRCAFRPAHPPPAPPPGADRSGRCAARTDARERHPRIAPRQ